MTHGTQGKNAPTPPTFLPAFVSVLGNHSPPAQQEPRLVQGVVISRPAALLLSTWAQIALSGPWGLDKQGWAASKSQEGTTGE